MATQNDVRRIVLKLPDVVEDSGRFAFSVRGPDKPKALCWVWLERKDPKQARVPQPAVLAVRVANLARKDMVLSAEPVKFFTEPHYNGYPAILVKLAEVSTKELEPLLYEAWRCAAPKALVREADAAAAPKMGGGKPQTAAPVRRRPAKGR